MIEAKKSGSNKALVAARGLVDQAARDLSAAGEKIQALEKLEIKGHLDVNQGAQSGDTVSGRLDKRKELIGALSVHLNNAEKAVTTLDGLKILPEKLISQRDRVLAEAQQNDARGQAEKFYNDAMTALERGDVAAAQNGYALLKQLYDQLVQEYQLRIVTADGKRLELPITSEEDGKTHTVKQWGLRVQESVFEQIKRDKMDDGIINNNVFGIKKRGSLQPRYLIPTTGGAIAQW